MSVPVQVTAHLEPTHFNTDGQWVKNEVGDEFWEIQYDSTTLRAALHEISEQYQQIARFIDRGELSAAVNALGLDDDPYIQPVKAEDEPDIEGRDARVEADRPAPEVEVIDLTPEVAP